MKELTVDYKWESGKSGSFVHRAFPEPLDVARACLGTIEDATYRETVAQSLCATPAFTSQYWGWFRQVLVTWRADAKRLREGNKSTVPLNAEKTAKAMERVKLPDYKAPSEVQDPFERGIEAANAARVKSGKAALTPAEIAQLKALYGITEYTS